MLFVSKKVFSCKMILSSSCPSSREGLEVIHECAVIIGRPVSLVMLDGEAVCSSLCTFGKSFIKGNCRSFSLVQYNSCRFCGSVKKSVLNLDVSFFSRELERLVKVVKLKSSIRQYVSLSESCLLYSVVYHEMGKSAHPMFLSVIVNITSLLSCSVGCKLIALG